MYGGFVTSITIGKDVYFDHLMVEHYTSEVLEENHYYPFGLTTSLNQNTNVTANPYKLTTKELESHFDLNSYDFGARMQDMTRGQWMTPDPLAEKYYSISPYAYCANNPVKYIDPNGKEIWINDDRNGRFQYKGGKLYDKDGKEYSGKVKGFLKQSVAALTKIGTSTTGADMIKALADSKNVFDIKTTNNDQKGDVFVPKDATKAEANFLNADAKNGYAKQGLDISGGSGGTIYWDIKGTPLPTTKGERYSRETDLAHEMAHGYDADRGLLDNRYDDEGLENSEYNAAYRENLIRHDLDLPYRTRYDFRDVTGTDKSAPLLDINSQPILPASYKP